MKEFKTYHPLVNFTYFTLVIGFSMFFMHPVCLVISLVAGFAYSVVLDGLRAFTRNLLYMLPLLIVAAVMNPAFNHQGVTVLGYFPGGNPLTLESVFYGLAAAAMLASVLCWFSCCSAVMTGDKCIYLFGRILPSLSLLLSMALRFVPKFAAQLKSVIRAQKCIGRDVTEGSLVRRMKCALSVLSVMVSWSLENAIETADSMKSRGYGLPGRTAFSVFTYSKRDFLALLYLALCGGPVLAGGLTGAMGYHYFPFMQAVAPGWAAGFFVAYAGLCVMPVCIELWEVYKWKAIQSRI